jgi:hypothetical protein
LKMEMLFLSRFFIDEDLKTGKSTRLGTRRHKKTLFCSKFEGNIGKVQKEVVGEINLIVLRLQGLENLEEKNRLKIK